MTWSRVAILAVTGEEVNGTWTTASLRCPPFTPGVGADKMPKPTLKDPFTKLWWYEGKELLALMRWHTHLVFQHTPPPGWINDLRDSKDSKIEEILFWIDVESTVAAGYWSKYQNQLEVTQRGFTLRAPVGYKNRFGNDLIDPYEGWGNLADPNDWKVRESKHSWFMDMSDKYIEEFVQVLATLMYKYRGVKVFTDNCYSWQYPGTATNVTQKWMLERGPGFIAGMQEYLSYLRKFGFGVWGNAAAREHNYPQLDAKLGELDLVDRGSTAYLTQLIGDSVLLGENARRGLRQLYIAHAEPRGQGPRWATMQMLWDGLATGLDDSLDDNMGIVTARSSRYLMCPTQCT